MTVPPAEEPMFDFPTCRLGRMQQLFRGPPPAPGRPYLACLGGAQTFARFCPEPYPQRLGAALGMEAVNLGHAGAGPGLFLADAGLVQIAAGARACVVEAMDADALSNRMYTVKPRRNGRVHEVSDLLRGIFPEVEFERFEQVRRMLRHLALLDPGRFRLVENEIANAWIGRMQTLLARIEVPVVLLWFSSRAPDDPLPDPAAAGTPPSPRFVTAAMFDAVAAMAAGRAVAAGVEGLPQDLTRAGTPVLFRPSGEPIETNRSEPSPAMHAAAAEALLPALREVLAG